MGIRDAVPLQQHNDLIYAYNDTKRQLHIAEKKVAQLRRLLALELNKQKTPIAHDEEAEEELHG